MGVVEAADEGFFVEVAAMDVERGFGDQVFVELIAILKAGHAEELAGACRGDGVFRVCDEER